MKRIIIIGAALICIACGCASTRAYKVTFGDGSVEYYELNYRPKPTDKSIHYDGQDILGVKKIEKLQ
jgi:hypothetical protein